jgi:hypothetical protein
MSQLSLPWDEGTLYTDNRCSDTIKDGCGGRTATLVIGPQVKPGYKSTTTYHNENVLKTACVAMGLSTCPGDLWRQHVPCTNSKRLHCTEYQILD